MSILNDFLYFIEGTRKSLTKNQIEDLKERGFFVYSFRHNPGNFAEPATIEEFVGSDFWGYGIAKKSFDIESWYDLSEEEIDHIMENRCYSDYLIEENFLKKESEL